MPPLSVGAAFRLEERMSEQKELAPHTFSKNAGAAASPSGPPDLEIFSCPHLEQL